MKSALSLVLVGGVSGQCNLPGGGCVQTVTRIVDVPNIQTIDRPIPVPVPNPVPVPTPVPNPVRVEVRRPVPVPQTRQVPVPTPVPVEQVRRGREKELTAQEMKDAAD